MQLPIAINRCTTCKYEWKDNPGAFSVHNQRCPKCGSMYFEWVNYNEYVEQNKNSS